MFLIGFGWWWEELFYEIWDWGGDGKGWVSKRINEKICKEVYSFICYIIVKRENKNILKYE